MSSQYFRLYSIHFLLLFPLHLCYRSSYIASFQIKRMETKVSDNNSCNSSLSSHDYTIYITITSSCLSMTGSTLIILTFLIWSDIRTVARSIVVFLAIADFFTAAGYLYGAVVSYLDKQHHFDQHQYILLCETQSFVTTAFPISSFLWTIHLAVYLYVAIVNAKPLIAKKLMIYFHVTGWGIPLAICLPALLTGHLGGSSERTSVNWCFVYFNDTRPNSERELKLRLVEYYGFEFLCGKFWEISASIIAMFLYVSVKVVLRRRMVSLMMCECVCVCVCVCLSSQKNSVSESHSPSLPPFLSPSPPPFLPSSLPPLSPSLPSPSLPPPSLYQEQKTHYGNQELLRQCQHGEKDYCSYGVSRPKTHTHTTCLHFSSILGHSSLLHLFLVFLSHTL